ncbi:hypothetical protein [uncultured Litoreibacter sp.]|uniref:hypothetical protein n=1 Tax=uncultured Litoreibacter sp. TaxID=1392394 RepID=UPI00261708A8|nr:hypothetical protein [uncultured Litoreibacter sp.]
MSTFLSREVQAGLEAAQKQAMRKRSRLRVHVGDEIYPILQFAGNTFTVDADTAPHLRGLVDIYDGGRHLYQALIVTSQEEAGEWVFEFKRNTVAANSAPRDFYEEPDAPIALLPAG